MRKCLITIALCVCSLLACAQTLSDSAHVYLLTCTPGTQVWSKYGHSAILVEDRAQGIDVVFNYGIFSFDTEDFYLKFIKGDTYYQLGIEPLRYFRLSAERVGRKVYWQRLNLTHTQMQQVFDALLVNYRPENRFYHYNFVFDNCATRPYHLIKDALGDTILSDYQGYIHQPYRRAISRYTGHNSWVDFGINLIFGRRADVPMDNEQRLFLPEELMFFMSEARLADGTPLVQSEDIAPFDIAPVPWYANCWLGIGLFVLVMVGISLFDRRRGRLTWWVDALLGLVYLILIAIVVFLTFFSSHPLVGFNWRLLLFPVLHLCARLIYILR